MNATMVEKAPETVKPASKTDRIDLFRWQKYIDGDGRLWIITCLFGFATDKRYGAMVELLNVDTESTIDEARTTVEDWIRTGTLKRIDTPLLL
ncbi:hypothetical protein IC229_05640 [Spirosoma sp. BT702]|uniref:Uncharacterized protein n=1 Tax=Spirosoma profusum TaxID=2771354 RepID=A0A927ATF9_9BACT|nr:hypothetical protein [Spirosoma profusum]MBD2700107.1 hypothetical protein [Spirosoma profusum]